jgi:teichuronic acid biosynthesis glycosyltransferase TuaC
VHDHAKKRLVTMEKESPGAERVLVVTNLWPTEDEPTYGIMVRRQVESLWEQGVPIDVLYVRGVESPLAYLSGAVLMLAWSLKPRRRYRLVHAHGGETLLAARFYVRAPLLVSFMGADLLGATREDGSLGRRWLLRTRVIRHLSRLARASITKSAEMEAVLPSRVQRHNTVMPNGVDRRLFAPLPQVEARAELGWDVDERVVLFVGRTRVPRKRFGLARQACEQAQRTLGPIRLHVAQGVNPEQIPILMSAADCLLHPAASEGSPNVVKEALACDLPVIATPVGDIPLLLDGVKECRTCPPTVDALGAALIDCLTYRRRSDGREKTKWLAHDYIAAALVALYDELDATTSGA